MNLSSRSVLRVLACAIALIAVSAVTTPAGAAPPDGGTPAQKAHAHRGHHRHLTRRQKARLRHMMQHRRHHREHNGGGQGQARGAAKPTVN